MKSEFFAKDKGTVDAAIGQQLELYYLNGVYGNKENPEVAHFTPVYATESNA